MNKKIIVITLLMIFLMVLMLTPASSMLRGTFANYGTFTGTAFIDGNVTFPTKTQNLGLWYKFDNQSEYGENSTHVYDFSGNGRNATLTGISINTTVYKYNSSIETINYSLGNITLDTPYVIPDGTSFTISFWGYRTNWVSGTAFLLGNYSGSNFIYMTSGGLIRLWSGGSNNDFSPNYVFPVNTWTMITIICHDSDIDLAKIYVNGTYYSKSSVSLCKGYGINNIGASTPRWWPGNLDEVMVWERVLGDGEIADLYAETYPAYYTKGNYTQIYQTFNSSENVSTDVAVTWREHLTGNSSINVYACVGDNYENCRNQTNGQILNISDNASSVKIWAELIADPSNYNNTPKLERLEPPKLSFYVDNQSAVCTDNATRNLIRAMNKSLPYCTISSAMDDMIQDTELIVRYGHYTEEISPSASPNLLGTKEYQMIIRGEDPNNKPIINGTGLGTNGIRVQLSPSNINFSNFYIINQSNDAMNIHGNSTDIFFDNILGINNGYNKDSAAGDCISFHDECQGGGSNLYCTNNYKSTVVDIQASNTTYYHLYGRNNRLYGIYFYGNSEGVVNGSGYHEVHNATIEDSPGCYWSEEKSFAEDITCNNISGYGILFRFRENKLLRFNVSSSEDNISILIQNATNYTILLKDGVVNNNITSENSTNVEIINVTINGNGLYGASNAGNMTVKWYLNVFVDDEDGDVIE